MELMNPLLAMMKGQHSMRSEVSGSINVVRNTQNVNEGWRWRTLAVAALQNSLSHNAQCHIPEVHISKGKASQITPHDCSPGEADHFSCTQINISTFLIIIVKIVKDARR
jgi:hypothetical protein